MTRYRMQVLIAQIRLLEQEILADDPASMAETENLETMKELKDAVDGMRSTLWCYLSGRQADVPACPDEIKFVRMNRVVEMFRTAKTGPREIAN
jgi:hypothetical protein